MILSDILIACSIYVILALLIAKLLGKKRQIGFKWSLFFSISLTPISGLIITMLSRKYPKNSKTKSSTKKILGQVFVLLGVIFLLGFLFNFELGDSPLIIILHISGIIGLGLYLIDLAEVKVENEEYS